MYVEFKCEKCDAVLKAKRAAAGRSVLCPKCGKKTKIVPLGEENDAPPEARAPEPRKDNVESPPPALPKQESAVQEESGRPSEPPSSAAPVPQPEQPTQAPPPASMQPKPSPEPGLQDALKSENNTLKQQIEKLQREVEEARTSLADAETARREALREAEEAGKKSEEEALGGIRLDLHAAQQRIKELEKELQERRIQGASAESAPSAGGTVTAPRMDPSLVLDEAVDPDSLISELQASRFGKYLRTAIYIHVAVLLLTSVVFLMNWTKNRFGLETEVPAPQAAPAAQETPQQEVLPAAPAAAVPEPATAAEQPEAKAEQAAEPVRPASAPAEKTDIEKKLESLPEPGELPSGSSVSLEGDL